MIPSMLAAHLGLPAAHPPQAKGKGSPATSLSAALSAHKAGDHHTAKKHALKAVNMLHRMAAPSQAPVASPSVPASAPASGAV